MLYCIVHLSEREQDTVILGDDLERRNVTVLEPCCRRLEVTSICKAISADWTEIGQLEVCIIDLGNVAT